MKFSSSRLHPPLFIVVPGAQKSKSKPGILPALGVFLGNNRLALPCKILSIPHMVAAGVQLGGSYADGWAPALSKAKFNVSPSHSTKLNVVLYHDNKIPPDDARKVYGRLVQLVNKHETKFRFGRDPVLTACTQNEKTHCGVVEKTLPGGIDNVL